MADLADSFNPKYSKAGGFKKSKVGLNKHVYIIHNVCVLFDNNFYSNANGHKRIGVHQMNAVVDIQAGKYGL